MKIIVFSHWNLKYNFSNPSSNLWKLNNDRVTVDTKYNKLNIIYTKYLIYNFFNFAMIDLDLMNLIIVSIGLK